MANYTYSGFLGGYAGTSTVAPPPPGVDITVTYSAPYIVRLSGRPYLADSRTSRAYL